MASDEKLLTEIQSLREEMRAEFKEVRTEMKALRAQVRTVEYGVLAMAQKLLAESEIREIRERISAPAA